MRDLTLFQLNALAIATGSPKKGLTIKSELEELYGSEVNHGRLYPNLDEMVEKGLLGKRERDKRTNEYPVTDAGIEVLEDAEEYLSGQISESRARART